MPWLLPWRCPCDLSAERGTALQDVGKDQAYRPRWQNIILLTVVHGGCVAALFYFSWSAVAVCFFLGWVSCCLGITLGWHRLLTHGSYKTSRPMK